MISMELISEVRRLLQARPQLSQRLIARMTGVSRATIGLVATGRRPDYTPRSRAEIAEIEDRQQGPPARCRGCGGLVYVPCRLCWVRAIKAEERARILTERNNPHATLAPFRRDRAGERIRERSA